MKINGKELKDIIKDGVMNITGDLKSLVVKKKSSSIVIQNGNVVSGDICGGNKFVQNINGGVNAKGVQFGCIGPGSSQQRIIINGEEVDTDIAQGIQVINVAGNVGKLDSACSVTVEGDVNGKVDSNGRVDIKGSVKGNIESNGRVTCGDVTGDIDSNGRVECGNVGGDVDAMGKVSMRK
jgi:cytoskeletal protein CcmA (bactofilin family)